jgi:hypothetical protein
MASENIGPNEKIIIAPYSCLMTTRSANSSDIGNIFKENPYEFNKTIQLATFLLYEKSKGSESF